MKVSKYKIGENLWKCECGKKLINNILNERDIQRQNNIINKLNCQFWRYNEYLDLLYKVN